MPHLRSESLTVDKGAYPYRWILVLDDGREYRVYNRGLKARRWQEVEAGQALYRVFVSRAGTRFTYTFSDRESRAMAGCERDLVRQLQMAMNAKLDAPPRLEWKGEQLYYFTGTGDVYRVHDVVRRRGLRQPVKPGTSLAGERFFVAAESSTPRRRAFLENDDERETSIENIVAQFKRAGIIARPAPPQSAYKGPRKTWGAKR